MDIFNKYYSLRMARLEENLKKIDKKQIAIVLLILCTLFSLGFIKYHNYKKTKMHTYYILYNTYIEKADYVEIKVNYRYYKTVYDMDTKEGLDSVIVYLTNKENRRIYINFYKELD